MGGGGGGCEGGEGLAARRGVCMHHDGLRALVVGEEEEDLEHGDGDRGAHEDEQHLRVVLEPRKVEGDLLAKVVAYLPNGGTREARLRMRRSAGWHAANNEHTQEGIGCSLLFRRAVTKTGEIRAPRRVSPRRSAAA